MVYTNLQDMSSSHGVHSLAGQVAITTDCTLTCRTCRHRLPAGHVVITLYTLTCRTCRHHVVYTQLQDMLSSRGVHSPAGHVVITWCSLTCRPCRHHVVYTHLQAMSSSHCPPYSTAWRQPPSQTLLSEQKKVRSERRRCKRL